MEAPRRELRPGEAPPPQTGNAYDDMVHEYDGIEEHNNHLPRWWLGILYATMAFSFVYWIAYEVLQSLPSPTVEHQQQVAAKRAADAAKAPANDDTLLALAKDGAIVAKGKTTFAGNCVACHGDAGQGKEGLGPNLTDKFWIHGGKPEAIYKTVKNGVEGKGMAPWGGQLGEDGVRSVVAFLLSVKNTNVAGRAPQGKEEP